MINQHSDAKPFEMTLANGKTQSFDNAGDMCGWYERQTPVTKKVRKRSKANIESRKKKATLHRQKKEAQE